MLSRSAFLAALAPVAGAHHERLDASGYHRGTAGAGVPLPARLLAAADAYHAMTEPRPHRAALSARGRGHAGARSKRRPARRRRRRRGARGGRAAGPAALAPGRTDRARGRGLGLLARGLQTKQVARALGISAKTADRHVQNAYGKIGVSTRAAAALFAMEHGLVAWENARLAGPRPRVASLPAPAPEPRGGQMTTQALEEHRRASARSPTRSRRVGATAGVHRDDYDPGPRVDVA